MKILIIEDEKLLAESLKTLLELKGFEVEVVYDGEDGAEYANSFEGGSDTWTFWGLPSGRYTPFVRNVDMGYTQEVNATGVVNFDLTSRKDYFQKSTPWPQEKPDVAVTEPLYRSPEALLNRAILDYHRSDKSGQYFCCADYVVLANEEGTRYNPVTENDSKTLNYYLWVLYQEYLFTEDGIKEMGGAHVPTNITLAEGGNGGWYLLNYWVPRDGSYYAEDIRAVFPGASVNDALDSQKYIMMQMKNTLLLFSTLSHRLNMDHSCKEFTHYLTHYLIISFTHSLIHSLKLIHSFTHSLFDK